MNIEDGDAVHQSIAAPGFSAPERAKPKRRKRQEKSTTGTGTRHTAGDSLDWETKRLLGMLGQPETWAFLDPTDPSSVLIHRRRSGISVGAGRFACVVADALVRQDLACWRQEASGRRALALTKAGEAHRHGAGGRSCVLPAAS